MTKISGKSVLITGGASGIGVRMAVEMARRGARRVIIWDLHPEKASDILYPEHYPDCGFTFESVDVTEEFKVQALCSQYTENGIIPDILVNNAGIIVGKSFTAHTKAEIKRTLEVNTTAPMLVTHGFLPFMMRKDEFHIVNIASAAAFVGNPGMSVYVASKWALTGWSDSLRLELKQIHRNFRVTTVNPYYIDTGMFAGVKSGWLLPLLNPDKVARRIVKAIISNHLVVRMPWLVNFTPALRGLLPLRVFDFIAGKLLGVYHTMESFKGREQS